MQIIKPSVEHWGACPDTVPETIALIERAGRLCYKSEDRITEDSALPFVQRLHRSGHWAMLEHSNFVVRTSVPELASTLLLQTPFLRWAAKGRNFFVGGNLTAWLNAWLASNGSAVLWPFYLAYKDAFGLNAEMTPMSCFIEDVRQTAEYPASMARHTVKFVCDRGVSHELVRHRLCSFAQESTRYVDLGGKDMEFIEPAGFEGWAEINRYTFLNSCSAAEVDYNHLLNNDMKPQQARAVLPNALKTEIVVTADAKEWEHIRKLRTAPSAHPDMRRLMDMVNWNEITAE